MTRRILYCGLFLGFGIVAGGSRSVRAHDVPDRFFDRAVQLTLHADRVAISYQLSVTQLTLAEELLALVGPGGLAESGPAERLDRYAREMGPLLARGLMLQVDGEEARVGFIRASHRVEDHVRFVFEMEAAVGPSDATRRVACEDTNYFLEKGRIRIAIQAASPIEIAHATVPRVIDDVTVRSSWEMTGEEQDAARRAHADYCVNGADGAAESAAATEIDSFKSPSDGAASPTSASGLIGLLDDSSPRWAFVLLTIAFFFGAAHAMTPGHGKAMVAAYLVGERGNLRHALGLGLTTSLTHTGSVLALALVLALAAPVNGPIGSGLSLLSGLLVAGLGAWLLIVRLRDRMRRQAIGGDSRTLGDAGESCRTRAARPIDSSGVEGPGWAGLMTLGISGGLVPCWDAVALLLFAAAEGQVARAISLLISFSAGLAATLVSVGILAVKLRGYLSSRLGSGRIVQSLPVVSAATILAVGLYLCLNTLRDTASRGAVRSPGVTAAVRSVSEY